MTKKKQNKKIIYVIGVFLLILIIGIFAIQQTKLPTYKSSQITKDGDMNTLEVTSLRWIDTILLYLNPSQQVAFNTQSAEVGDEILISDIIKKGTSISFSGQDYKYLKSATFKISQKTSVGWSSISAWNYLANPIYGTDLSNNIYISATFKPSEAGEYKGDTRLNMCTDSTLTNCREFYYLESSFDERVIISESYIPPVEQTCIKSPYSTDWETIQNIDGGVIKEKTYYTVSSGCEYVISQAEKSIECISTNVNGFESNIAPYTGSETCASEVTDDENDYITIIDDYENNEPVINYNPDEEIDYTPQTKEPPILIIVIVFLILSVTFISLIIKRMRRRK